MGAQTENRFQVLPWAGGFLLPLHRRISGHSSLNYPHPILHSNFLQLDVCGSVSFGVRISTRTKMVAKIGSSPASTNAGP